MIVVGSKDDRRGEKRGLPRSGGGGGNGERVRGVETTGSREMLLNRRDWRWS